MKRIILPSCLLALALPLSGAIPAFEPAPPAPGRLAALWGGRPMVEDLRALLAARPGLVDFYDHSVSKGRRQRFLQEVMRGAAYQERLHYYLNLGDALLRVRIADEGFTLERFMEGCGHDELDACAADFARIAALDLSQARRVKAQHDAEAAAGDPGRATAGRLEAAERAEYIALAARWHIPRREGDGVGSFANAAEWFVRGGEAYFNGARPLECLTSGEQDFWARLERSLKGQAPWPF